MATSQTTPPSTDLVYTEPALTAELLDRFDTFAREVALHDGVSAFSEQTRIELTKALRERTGSDWFRPEGFFIASEKEDDASIAAFTWTKIPTGQVRGELSPAGEIYVVGVNPDSQGGGLGRTLTLRALAYLALAADESGEPLHAIELYVDADNTAAYSLYTSLGFSVATVDRMYAPGHAA